MHLPPYLKKGDTILIIATARKTTRELIAPAIKILDSWGFKSELSPYLFEEQNQFAGSDEVRARSLQWALDHPFAKAILISGGGYGTMRIIDQVNLKKFKHNPKWIAGYSDATVLHARLQKKGYCSIHSTMAFQMNRHPGATTSLLKALTGRKINYTIPAADMNRTGTATAEITGGNLSLLYALSGSKDDVSTVGKILFIEDLDEYLYHIDRMMQQLKRSGKLKNLKGLIVGGMSDMKDNSVPFGKTAEEIILETVSEYNYPVCFNFPAGHVAENMSLMLGRHARLVVQKNKVTLNYTS